MKDHLLTETERQQKYLDDLPEDFSFPLFNAKTALESQRKSGYRDTASACRELVDNAWEAKADEVHVAFDTWQRKKGAQKTVRAVAVIDQGAGMLPKMARYALTWGGGTHFDSPDQIGKFGFGLPNASINQTRLTEVYTRLEEQERITKAVLDLDKFGKYGIQSIPEPEEVDELPDFVQKYMDRHDLTFEHGTVVVWEHPDRLTYKTPQNLKNHLMQDFGVTYRYLLDNPRDDQSASGKLKLVVDGTQVEPVDPMFLEPGFRFYVPEEEGGAQCVEDMLIPVKLYEDDETGELTLERIEEDEDVDANDEEGLLVRSVIRARISRFPFGFVVGRGAKGTDADKRFQIRKSRRGMSFVRSNREIETVDVFPKSNEDKAAGLGDWPLLQSHAYHWGIEVRFKSELDEAFGITNDKQSVRPIEDFWKVLAEEDVDSLLNRENNWQKKKRHEENTAKNAEEKARQNGKPSPAEQAAADAEDALGERVEIPEDRKEEARENLEKKAEEEAERTSKPVPDVREALEKEAERVPYKIDFFHAEYGPVWKPEWNGRQVVVSINQAHEFFQTVYGPLYSLEGGLEVKEGLDLLLIALSKGELESSDQMQTWYETQRIEKWSSFLSVAIKSLVNRQTTIEEEEEF